MGFSGSSTLPITHTDDHRKQRCCVFDLYMRVSSKRRWKLSWVWRLVRATVQHSNSDFWIRPKSTKALLVWRFYVYENHFVGLKSLSKINQTFILRLMYETKYICKSEWFKRLHQKHKLLRRRFFLTINNHCFSSFDVSFWSKGNLSWMLGHQ